MTASTVHDVQQQILEWRRRQADHDWADVLATPAGRRVLASIIERADPMRPGERTPFQAGRADLALTVVNAILAVDAGALARAQEELREIPMALEASLVAAEQAEADPIS